MRLARVGDAIGEPRHLSGLLFGAGEEHEAVTLKRHQRIEQRSFVRQELNTR